MLEVTTYNARGEQIDCGEGCEDLATAYLCANTLWEDSVRHGTGVQRAVIRDERDVIVRCFTSRPSRYI